MASASDTAPILSRADARNVYDRIGAFQDTQAFYEDRATSLVVVHGRFDTARRVFELGCGTGRFAERLLARHLPADARYRGIDLSPTMVQLAAHRLTGFGDRASVALTDGAFPTAEAPRSYDRFVSNFVLDLLSEEDIAAAIREAERLLETGGLLCLASLSTGRGMLPRLAARVWVTVHAFRPALLGGCRPLDLLAWIPSERWTVLHHAHLAPFGVPSEVVVAERRGAGG